MAELPGNRTVSDTLGALFLGNLAAAILYGITCVQTYIYYRKSYNDSLAFKLLIFFLWFLDCFHLALISHGSYYYLISKFGNATAIQSPTWTILIHVYVTLVINTFIRAIFGRRVWLLSNRSFILTGCIAVTSCLALVTTFVFTTKAFIIGTFKSFSDMPHLLGLLFGNGVAADILIAASLCFSLSRSRTGIKRTESVINVIMMYIINTCLLTVVTSAACFITYLVWPHTLIFVAIFYSFSKLYFNSLLATLNARETLMEKLGEVEVEGGLSDLARSGTEHRHNPVEPMSELVFERVAVAISEEVDSANEESRSTLINNPPGTATS